jgi:undecaprenyl-diphosphatase
MHIDFSNPWNLVTLLGSPELWVVFAAFLFGAYLAFRTGSLGGAKTRKLLFLLIPTLLIVFVMIISMKSFFDVPRQCIPCITDLIECNPNCMPDASFPSGHAATAFAGFTIFWIIGGRKKKWLLLYIVPFLVAVSRIMLNVHTPADVFAGALLGIVVAVAVNEIDERV